MVLSDFIEESTGSLLKSQISFHYPSSIGIPSFGWSARTTIDIIVFVKQRRYVNNAWES